MDSSSPCFALSSIERLRDDLGPDAPVSDREFDSAAADAVVLFLLMPTPTPKPSTFFTSVFREVLLIFLLVVTAVAILIGFLIDWVVR